MRRNSIMGRMTASRCFRTVASIFIGLAVTGALLLVFSALLVKLDDARSVAPVLSLIAMCSGAYFSASYYSSRRRRHGMITGLACGVLCYCVVYLAGAIILGAAMNLSILSKLVAVGACGAIGGIKGVNGRRKFKKGKRRRRVKSKFIL